MSCFALQWGMEGEPADSPLDLSHLTEVEQSKILQVLQRDLDLRLRDEGRVRSEVTANRACTSHPPWRDVIRKRVWSFLDNVQGPPGDRDGSETFALHVGHVVFGRAQQAPSHLVGQRPRARHHTPQANKEQRSVSVRSCWHKGIPLMRLCCCYSNRLAPDRAVQQWGRESLAQWLRLSRGREEAEGVSAPHESYGYNFTAFNFTLTKPFLYFQEPGGFESFTRTQNKKSHGQGL